MAPVSAGLSTARFVYVKLRRGAELQLKMLLQKIGGAHNEACIFPRARIDSNHYAMHRDSKRMQGSYKDSGWGRGKTAFAQVIRVSTTASSKVSGSLADDPPRHTRKRHH
jgi:hypothetical protein